ncbi:hypothetical protein RYA05_01300 [Pseudomonas syringae pv. actinidiae]|nr:hypothetical protein [Pseudomonas syringae pv. actinidiae]
MTIDWNQAEDSSNDEDDFILGAAEDGEKPQACPLDPEGRDQCESCQ